MVFLNRPYETNQKANFQKLYGRTGQYLKETTFKIPPHTLLPEDAPWDGVSQSAAKHKLMAVEAQMQKIREKYKVCLYKKKYLRAFTDKVKEICILQEETIQKE